MPYELKTNDPLDLREEKVEAGLSGKKRKLIGKREVIIALIAVVLATVGIKASDSFLETNAGEGLDSNGCPSDMVFIDTEYGGFCIDKYENSAAENCSYETPDSKTESAYNLGMPECKPVSLKDKIPWRNITQTQAIEACAKAGKRLPTNKEWYAASLGTPDPGSSWSEEDCQVDKNWNAQPGQTGSAENCLSSAGAYDMVGNVWEWVHEEAVDGKYDETVLPESGYVKAVNIDGLPLETDASNPDSVYNGDYFWIKESGVRGMARGGYWDNKEEAGKNAVYLVSPPSFAGVGMGFRCVK